MPIADVSCRRDAYTGHVPYTSLRSCRSAAVRLIARAVAVLYPALDFPPGRPMSLRRQQPLPSAPIPTNAYHGFMKAPTGTSVVTASVHINFGHHGDGITSSPLRLILALRGVPATGLESPSFLAPNLDRAHHSNNALELLTPLSASGRCASRLGLPPVAKRCLWCPGVYSTAGPLHPLAMIRMCDRAVGGRQRCRTSCHI